MPMPVCLLTALTDRTPKISYETPQVHRFILELFPLCHDVRDTSLSRFSAVAGAGTRVKLTGITGDSSEAEFVDAIFPVVTKDQQRYLIRIQGQNIVATKATNTIMSLAVLLKADAAPLQMVPMRT